ncbi:hypothetical protein TL16_g10230 [Triparma laevis f. inornata]|uniref:Uncharacterized protein n=1 Tax=Triparma laevis f. inornata TaxID=1714386 RepID=A0A9W7BEU0_9STRA|nr:hypothetical protein TL16_g10230 [Triparma laevis f. inornata]
MSHSLSTVSASRTTNYPGNCVTIPFGKGVIIEERATDVVVQLHEETWVLAYGQKPTLYLDPAIVAKDGGGGSLGPTEGYEDALFSQAALEARTSRKTVPARTKENAMIERGVKGAEGVCSIM